MTDGEFVRLEVDGGIGTIRLDRPPMNALNVQVQEELRAAAAEAGDAGRRRAPSSSTAARRCSRPVPTSRRWRRCPTPTWSCRSGALQSSFTAVATIPKPVVAAVTGYALGGGCELALCADLRVCGDNAKLGQPEILLGVIPGAGGTQRLPRLVGPARAKDIIFTGRFVDAEEALRIGLVDQVVPADDVYASRARAGRPASSAARRSRCAPRRRPSTAGSRSTSTPGSRSSGCSSPACSPPRTARSA